MRQERIKKLLEEAADPRCPPARLSEIHREMNSGWPHGMDNPVIGVQDVLRQLAEELFTETVENRRERLPGFFPVFAMVYGDRADGRRYADINWLLA